MRIGGRKRKKRWQPVWQARWKPLDQVVGPNATRVRTEIKRGDGAAKEFGVAGVSYGAAKTLEGRQLRWLKAPGFIRVWEGRKPRIDLQALNERGAWTKRWNSFYVAKLGGFGVGFVELNSEKFKVVTAFGRSKIFRDRLKGTLRERLERKVLRVRKLLGRRDGRDQDKQYARPLKRKKNAPIGRGGGGTWN